MTGRVHCLIKRHRLHLKQVRVILWRVNEICTAWAVHNFDVRDLMGKQLCCLCARENWLELAIAKLTLGSQPRGRVALTIHVHYQHFLLLFHRQIKGLLDTYGALTHPAFLVGEADDFCHTVPYVVFSR
ncbi:hypothetical protein D3C72_909830 [compost metagenome]